MTLPRLPSMFSLIEDSITPTLIFLAFLITRLPYCAMYSDWDEIGFVSQAGWLDQGYEPYRNFGSTHPPFWLWTVVGIWRVFQLSDPWSKYYAAKVLSASSVAVTGAILYIIAEQLYSSRISGLMASALFFTSFNSFYYGVTAAPEYFTVMLTLMSITSFLFGSSISVFLSSLALGLGMMSRYSVAPIVLVFVAFVVLRARLEKDGRLFPLALFGLAIPVLVSFLFYGTPVFYTSFGYVDPRYAHLMSLDEKYKMLLSVTYTPIFLFAILGVLPFLLVGKNWKRYFILLSLIGMAVLWFIIVVAEQHKIIESEPLACIIGAAITVPFTKRFKTSGGSLRISNSVHLTQIIGVSILLFLMMTSTTFLAAPRIDTSLRKVTDESRNIGLQTIVRCVKEHTNQDDFVICGYPLIAFLADRKMPPIRGDENLTEVSLQYDAKLVTIGAGFSPQYFGDYVRKNYVFIQEFPYWGSVYVRRQ